jgi:acyl-coenzyme A thioesterase PaaI-like protein
VKRIGEMRGENVVVDVVSVFNLFEIELHVPHFHFVGFCHSIDKLDILDENTMHALNKWDNFTSSISRRSMATLDRQKIDYVQGNFRNNFKFRLMLWKELPMGFSSGMKIKELTDERCQVTVPYKRKNKNPFQSTFWAVLGMAAEMSSGAMMLQYTHNQKPSIAMLVANMSSEFVKKATDLTTFTCNDGLKIKAAIEKTIDTGEPELIECKMTGKNEAGDDVAHFLFTWSVKARKA